MAWPARSALRLAPLALALSSLPYGCACNRTEEPVAPVTPEAASGSGSGATSGSGAVTVAGSPSAAGSGSASGGAAGQSSVAPVCTVAFGSPAPIASKATDCPKDPTGNLKLPMGRVTFSDAPNQPVVNVEVAGDQASMERGLMYRTSMPDNAGMIFSYQNEAVRTFWMKNTCIPLDMLFINKGGVVSGILEQVPTLNLAGRSINCPVAHVLELNAGWARAHGIAPGMKVKIEG